MRVIHIVTSISAECMGPSQSVPALCKGLAAEGLDVELHYLDYGGRPVVPDVPTVAYDRTLVPGFRFAAWSLPLLMGLFARAKPNTIFHAHGLWQFPTIYPAWVGGLTRTPWVCSPRGTIGEWVLQRSRIKKAISLRLGQQYALDHASLMHATSEAEAADLRAFGLTQDTIVVPNVVEDAPFVPQGPRSRRDLLFMGRLHPKKGLDRLIDAWEVVARSHPDVELVIAGPSEGGYGEVLAADVAKRGVPRVRFVGPLSGEAKWQALAQARGLVVPSHNENFGMVVAEALSVGTPVIASTGTPWEALSSAGAGWWVENTVSELIASMTACLSESVAAIDARGERGKALVERTMSPRTVARAMIQGYERIASQRAQGLPVSAP